MRRPTGASQGTHHDSGTSSDASQDNRDAGQNSFDAGPLPDAGPGADAFEAPDVQGPGRDANTPFPDAAEPHDAGFIFPDAAGPAPDAGFPDMDSGIWPDATPMLTTIGDIRAGFVPPSAYVTLREVAVTAFHDEATRPDTLWVQDPSGGSSNAGVKVFVRGAHQATRDARVDVTGTVLDYFGEIEINDATVTLIGASTALTPIFLSSSEAMLEQYEGMLVHLTDVTSINAAYVCSTDDPMCMDQRLWELNGTGGILVYNYAYEGADWDSRSGSTGITGVMTWRYNRRRIMPRTGTDFSP